MKNQTLLISCRSFLICSFYVIYIPIICTQSLLEGVLLDNEKGPIVYANVLLFNNYDSTLYKGAISNDLGYFEISNIESGKYFLEVSVIGYDRYSVPISFITNHENTDLGIITLQLNPTMLDGITVTARKMLFEKKIDRTIVNVQANAINKGNTVLNVLRSSPGLLVTNDEIIMLGKQGVSIMLNGKLIRMPLEGIMQMLEGMSATNVESIELITNPGAQFEAEGNAGFINIVLIDAPDKGWNASIGATIGMNLDINAGTNVSLQYRADKFSANASYSLNYDNNDMIWNVYQSNILSSFQVYSDSKTNRNSKIQNQNLNIGMTYLLDPKTELSFLLTGAQSLNKQNDRNHTVQKLTPSSSYYINASIIEPNSWLNGSSSLGIKHKFSKSSSLKIFYDHLRYYNDQSADYDLEFTSSESSDLLESNLNTNKTTPIRFNVLSADYNTIINSNITISTGGRLAFSHFMNEVETNLSGYPIYEFSEIQPSTFLDEDITAAYLQLNYQSRSKITLEGGIRYEHTVTDLRDGLSNDVVYRNYDNWFPTAKISYQLKEHTSLQLVYNRRITRPTFNDLAPFVFFQNPSTLIQGNSSLLPAIMDAVDLSLNRGSYWITFQYAKTKNFISFFTPEINDKNNVTYSTQNLNFMEMLGVNFNTNIQFTPWWSSINSLSFQNSRIEDVRSGQTIDRTIKNVLINFNHSFQIRKNTFANLGFNYNHNGFVGLTDYKPQWMLNAGISKRMKNGGQLSLRLADIFSSYVWNGIFEFENSNQSFLFDQNMRAVNIAWSMPIGNDKLKSVKVENGSVNERARVN